MTIAAPTAPTAPSPPASTGRVLATTQTALDQLGLTDDPEAAVVLAIAGRLDSPHETGAAIASLARQYSVLIAGLRRRGVKQTDTLDEIADRAARKLHA